MLRLLLLIAFVCNILGSGKRIEADGMVPERPDKEEQIQRYDGFINHMAEEPQTPVGAALRSLPSSHRVGSSRPSRIIPTHGGKPTHHFGRWTNNEWSNLFNGFALLSYRLHGSRTLAASQRLYYVIALRRLLC